MRGTAPQGQRFSRNPVQSGERLQSEVSFIKVPVRVNLRIPLEGIYFWVLLIG